MKVSKIKITPYGGNQKGYSIQFNSVYLYSAKLQQLSRHLNNMVQFKPIGIKFIVIIIQ